MGFFGPAHPGNGHGFRSDSANKGFVLFNHVWGKGDVLAGTGDGLGPVFNAKSCATCHPGGGAAGNEHNVQLLTEKNKIDGVKLLVLHRQGTDPGYQQWREHALGLKGNSDSQVRNQRLERYRLRKYQSRPPVFKIPTDAKRDVRLSERNTPALFGAALIDTVTLDDLKKLELQQEKQNDGISGRVPMVDHRPGRFGWRGQTATLEDFVMGACSNELGLQVKGHAQPADPTNPDYRAPGDDMTFEQCQNLIAFVASLDAPVQLEPRDERHQQVLRRGERLLTEIHCARCHAPTVGNVTGIFSDLLLHDMGPDLADPIPAKPHMVVAGIRQSSAGYFGTVSEEILQLAKTNVHSEWRTPPLWGIANTAPYMHDGRADTLIDAIKMHGGEAAGSRKLFLSMPKQDQDALLEFLQSLSTKPQAKQPPALVPVVG